jgi:hypothetical protein
VPLQKNKAFAEAYRQTYYADGQIDRPNEGIWRPLALIGRRAEGIPGELDGVEKQVANVLRIHGEFS